MLDTVLNLGLNDQSVVGLARATENERFAWDSYRRFVQMFGNVSRGIPGDRFEKAIRSAKSERGVKDDTELDVDALKQLTETFQGIYREHTDEEFPQEPQDQLRLAIRAVFDSWVGDRAVEYRRLNRIPDDWGTAVNVQEMVFGNKGDSSGSGVAFSRDEVTGAPEPSGDFLPNAQGEDVVSGVRTPRDIAEIKEWLPEVHAELMEILSTLEGHYKDMQDTEFTVEEGRLYMLQTRNAKRPAQAAVRFAVDAVQESLLTREEALDTIDPSSLDALLHPTFDPKADFDVLASGVSASPGAAKGAVVFTASDAVAAAEDGRDVILVRPFTDAEDVAGFHAAKGILTTEGGKASHAALVARGMGRPAVVGVDALVIDLAAKTITVDGTELHEGDLIAIDGTKGCVTAEDVPLVDALVDDNFEQVLSWADDLRDLGVRANADTPEDARRARELGAEGIGLCRTEHMFMAEDRQPKMRAMVMADTQESRRDALAELLPLQQEDFEGLFEAMSGRARHHLEQSLKVLLLQRQQRGHRPDATLCVSAMTIAHILGWRSSPMNMCSVRHSPMPSAPSSRARGASSGCRRWRGPPGRAGHQRPALDLFEVVIDEGVDERDILGGDAALGAVDGDEIPLVQLGPVDT